MINCNTIFEGRKLVIATKHKKEKVITPIVEKALGVTCLVFPDLDTDTFGTFSGEVERTDSPLITARKKCLKAMELSPDFAMYVTTKYNHDN